MAIGTTPIIPLNRFVPSPDARFQRFGVNDTQLFGKPVVDLAAPKVRTPQPPTSLPHATAQAHEAAGSKGGAGAEPSTSALGYSAKAGNQPGTGAAPKVGTLLNTKA